MRGMENPHPATRVPPPPASHDQALRQALAHHEAGQLEDAVRVFQSILQTESNHPEANYHLGVLAMQAHHFDAALDYYNVALDADPTRGPFWLGYIDALFQAGRPDEARQVLELARQHGLSGDDVDALAGRLANAAPQKAQKAPVLAATAVRNAKENAKGPSATPAKAARKSPSHKGKAPPSQEMDALVSLVSQGQFEQAISHARSMTARFPLHGFGWKALGTVLNLSGRNEEALAPLENAARFMPGDAELRNNLGTVLLALGRLDEAMAAYHAALKINPRYAEAHCNLGATLQEAGKLDEAEASYRCALQIRPDYAKAHCNLGAALQALDREDEAEASYRRALQAQPQQRDAHYNLGVLLQLRRRFTESEVHLRRASEIAPADAKTWEHLGITLHALGRHGEAEACLRRALEIDPEFADAHFALGNMLADLGRLEEAALSFRRALQFTTEHAKVLSNLGSVLQTMGRLKEAEANCQCALAMDPNNALAHSALAGTLVEMGRLDEAEASYHRSLELSPRAGIHSALLFMKNHLFRYSPAENLAEARKYGQQVASAATPFKAWSCARQPKRLRVGLVSGDLRNHPVGYFLESLLAHLDPSSIELIAYATSPQSDPLTERIKPCFSAWKPLTGLTDEAAAHMIHADGLHVLVDLSGHTAKNRLPVFAWKPAPVQTSWLGYFATTGVPGMDYVLGDPHVTPLSEAGHFTERIWQLPASYLCFTEPDVPLDVTPLPALASSQITFGSFNNLSKMNDAVVAVWSDILNAVPSSRLFLKASQLGDPSVCQETRRRFLEHGIATDRLILEGKSPRSELLAAYQRVDVALDPFPYPGGTTTIESLWMGVPVITKRGDRFLSHVGETIARNGGLSGWIAADDHDYVAKAVAFVSDLDELAALRTDLRQQVLNSPLFDAASFARQFDEAIWGMWNQWLNQQDAA